MIAATMTVLVSGVPNPSDEQSVERERRATSNLNQRFLAAATLTVTFVVLCLIIHEGKHNAVPKMSR